VRFQEFDKKNDLDPEITQITQKKRQQRPAAQPATTLPPLSAQSAKSVDESLYCFFEKRV
jgi:hypothetical protein